MRTILMIAALMISQAATAGLPNPGPVMPVFQPEMLELPEGSATLTPMAGEEISRTPICGKNKLCGENGTILKLKFHLGGCMDTMSQVTHLVDFISKTVYVSAQHIGNEQSMAAFCIAEPIAVVDVRVSGLEDDFKVRYVGTEPNEYFY